jgi:hypothetical protein
VSRGLTEEQFVFHNLKVKELTKTTQKHGKKLALLPIIKKEFKNA